VAYSGAADDGEVEDYRWLFGAVGDFVWNDQNDDGLRQAAEPPIAGVRVFADLNGDGLYQTNEPAALTDALGAYSLGGFSPGAYTIAVDAGTLPDGAVPVYDPDGTNTLNRSAVTVTNGQIRTDADFGYRGDVVLGDYVWNDLNTNGLQDAGEPGYGNVTVRLYDTATNLLASTQTAADGAYTFSNLVAGTYFLGFVPPPGLQFTLQDQDEDNVLDSDADPATGYTAAFTLPSGVQDLNWDAGFYGTLSGALLGDFAWVDGNRNGVQDAGEIGLSNAVMTLYNSQTNVMSVTTSDVNGAYAFAGIATGTYFVGFVPPAGYFVTPANIGTNDNLDSDAAVSSGYTPYQILLTAETITNLDAGFYQYASVRGSVFDDRNGNGAFDVGETNGLAGVMIVLVDTNGVGIATNYTDAAGAYAFTNLLPDAYTVVETDPDGYISMTDVAPPNDNRIPVVLTSGQTLTEQNFLDSYYGFQVSKSWIEDSQTNTVYPDLTIGERVIYRIRVDISNGVGT
jgi:protocatechuate 3,4-dioxygenase beta subunit